MNLTTSQHNSSTSTTTVDTLIHAEWIVPIDGATTVLENHSVVIDQGNILAILPSAQAREDYQARQVHDLPHHVVMPGLINAHGHAPMSLFRGLANDMPLMDWLQQHIWPAEGQWVNEDFVRDGTELAIAEMLQGGTTTYSDMYFFPEIAAQQASSVGIRAQFVCPILDFPTVWGAGPDEYIAKTLELAHQYRDSHLITVGFGPHAPYTVSDEPLAQLLTLANTHQLPLQIHLHETQHEVDESLAQQQQRPLNRLKDLGYFDSSQAIQCVHMTALNDADIETLQHSKASIIHCPESNLKLASGFCPVAKLLDNDLTVALGTDGAASNNDLDMFGEMRTAALIAKPVANDASAVNAMTALEMATINGARALGIDAVTGSLAPQKAADIIAIDMKRLHTVPSYDIVADLVYNTAANQVSYVWVAGKLQVEQGNLCHLDRDTIIAKAKHWAAKINQGSRHNQ